MHEKSALTYIPPWYRGVSPNHRGAPKEFQVLSFDTETCFGVVYHTGFYDGAKFSDCRGIKQDHWSWLLEQTERAAKKDATVILVAHFLSFDLGVLTYPFLFHGHKIQRAPKKSWFPMMPPADVKALMVKSREENWDLYKWRDLQETTNCSCQIFWGRPCFATLRFGSKTVHVIDTYAYFTMKLERALKMVKAPVQKLKAPPQLGSDLIPAYELRPYLKNDTKGVWYLGQKIVEWHQEYDVKLCVSAPQLAGRILRHCFIKERFQKLSLPIWWHSMLSYHGGKNSLTCEPGRYEQCYELDINSAYPAAMRQLPDFARGKWKIVKKVAGPHGIYCVTGSIKPCPWGSLFTHDFKKIKGKFQQIWVTGYELHDALKLREIHIEKIVGYVWEPDPRPLQSPFQDFVDHFYKKKADAKDREAKEEEYFYKLMMNSLYGKFIQRAMEEDVDGNPYRVAGSMFHPFIGSLITGYVRAQIHQLEHKYQALHTATDSIKTLKPPDPADLGKHLGALKLETFGPCTILRNKLYVHFSSEDPDKEPKVGLHGFQESWQTLLKLHQTQQSTYKRKRLIRWAEAWHKGLQPGQEVTTPMELHL